MISARDFLRSFGQPTYVGDLWDGNNYLNEGLDDENLWKRLDEHNKAGADIYFCPNELGFVLNAKGHLRHNANVRACRALFIEFDDDHEQLMDFVVPPSFILTRRNRSNRYHVYWIIEHTTDIKLWRLLTRFLVQTYGSDKNVKDQARLMRLPNFLHMKDPQNPDIYDITHIAPTKYTIQGLAAAHGMKFDWTGLSEERVTAQYVNPLSLDKERYLKRYAKYIADLGDVNSGRNEAVFNAALKAKKLGLDYAEAFDMFYVYYVNHFTPFEDEQEFTIAFDKGYYTTTETVHGSATSAFAFQSLQGVVIPVPPPPPPRIKILNDPAREVSALIRSLDIPLHRLITAAPMGEFPTNDTLAAAVVIQCLKNPCNGSLQLASTDRGLFVYREVIWQEVNDDELRRIITFLSVEAAMNGEGKKPLSSDKISGTIKQIRSYTYEHGLSGRLGVCKFNGDGTITERFDVIPMRNGLLDINTDELIPHSADWFYTSSLPFEYHRDATCHEWIKWLHEVFYGDVEQVARMQEWFGLNLTRDTKFQKFALLKGAPRSGKGTTIKVLEHLVGKGNYCGAELYQLASDPTLLAMSNVQTCTMGDVHTVQGNDQNKILSKIKSIVGEDEQLINRKFMTAITCRIPAKITMAANSVPQFFDESGALAARILLFIYRRGHGGNDIDTGLFDRLVREDRGIFLWALEGLRRLYSVGRFTESTTASQYMRAIKEDTQPTLMFIEACLEVTGMPEHKAPVTKVYELYKRWSFMSDRRPLAPSSFADKLQSASGELVHRAKGRVGTYNGSVFVGCRIMPEAEASPNTSSNVVPMPMPKGVV